MIIAFLKGFYEFRCSFTTHYANDVHANAYDWGREWAHRITLRRFDNQ